ncbi:hypothetical protein LCGC14_2685550 [marine sediment metagenome]|uniref:Uncharacterized protein n=1 Tax=marine sediment metagenome TaxID=412755 RepID=A0A0F9A7K2_9ZZZZ
MGCTTGIKHLVEKFEEHKDSCKSGKTDHNKNLIQRQIDYTDSEIDKLVYELYDLTEDEIRIVEGE